MSVIRVIIVVVAARSYIRCQNNRNFWIFICGRRSGSGGSIVLLRGEDRRRNRQFTKRAIRPAVRQPLCRASQVKNVFAGGKQNQFFRMALSIDEILQTDRAGHVLFKNFPLHFHHKSFLFVVVVVVIIFIFIANLGHTKMLLDVLLHCIGKRKRKSESFIHGQNMVSCL